MIRGEERKEREKIKRSLVLNRRFIYPTHHLGIEGLQDNFNCALEVSVWLSTTLYT